jgi:hypothetical protein
LLLEATEREKFCGSFVALGYGEDALMNGLVGGFDDYGMKIGVA